VFARSSPVEGSEKRRFFAGRLGASSRRRMQSGGHCSGDEGEVNYSTLGVIVTYAVAGGVVLFMAFLAWLTTMWGFSPLAIIPLYIFGFAVFGVCIAVARALRKSN
jgi:hypothetical protein